MTKKNEATEVKVELTAKEKQAAAWAKLVETAKNEKVNIQDSAALFALFEKHPAVRAELDAAFIGNQIQDPVVAEVTRILAARGQVNFVTVTSALTEVYEKGSEATKASLKKFVAGFENNYDKVTEYFQEYFEAQGMELTATGVVKEAAYLTADALRFTGTTTKEILYWIADRIEDGTHWVADVIDGMAGERPEARQFNKVERAFKPAKQEEEIEVDAAGIPQRIK